MQADPLVPKYAKHSRAELVMELDDILRLLHTSRDACAHTPPAIDAVIDAPLKKKEKKEKDKTHKNGKKDNKLGIQKNISNGVELRGKEEGEE